jgi:hypothetical protein
MKHGIMYHNFFNWVCDVRFLNLKIILTFFNLLIKNLRFAYRNTLYTYRSLLLTSLDPIIYIYWESVNLNNDQLNFI